MKTILILEDGESLPVNISRLQRRLYLSIHLCPSCDLLPGIAAFGLHTADPGV